MDGSTVAALVVGGGSIAGGAALAARSLLRPLAARGVPLLRYRLVGPPRPASPLNDLRVPMSRFEPVIRHLARRGFRTVSMSEALAGVRSREFLRSDPLSLSFDGPSRDFLTSAWPVLTRHGLHRVELFFPAVRLGHTQLAFTEGRPEPLLSPDDLLGLARDGVTIGLQALPPVGADEAGLLEHLREGRERLRELTGQAVEAVAAPSASPTFSRAARRAGFRAVAMLGEGVAYRRTSPSALPRFDVQPTTTLLEVALVASRRVGPTIW